MQDLQVTSTYTSELPGDPETENSLRQVGNCSVRLPVSCRDTNILQATSKSELCSSNMDWNAASRYHMPCGHLSPQPQVGRIPTLWHTLKKWLKNWTWTPRSVQGNSLLRPLRGTQPFRAPLYRHMPCATGAISLAVGLVCHCDLCAWTSAVGSCLCILQTCMTCCTCISHLCRTISSVP